jgi:hypothetical protein
MSGGDGHSANVGSLAQAEQIGVLFATSKGISADDPNALTKLRALSAEAVTDGLNLEVMFNPAVRPRTYGYPFADGMIAVDSGTALRTGAFAKVPTMIGATSADLGGRTGYMLTGARNTATTTAAAGVPVYAYRFSYVAESEERGEGARHAADIPFFFDTVDVRYQGKTTPRDRGMSKAMSAYLVNFAKSGNPNGGKLPVGHVTAAQRMRSSTLPKTAPSLLKRIPGLPSLTRRDRLRPLGGRHPAGASNAQAKRACANHLAKTGCGHTNRFIESSTIPADSVQSASTRSRRTGVTGASFVESPRSGFREGRHQAVHPGTNAINMRIRNDEQAFVVTAEGDIRGARR